MTTNNFFILPDSNLEQVIRLAKMDSNEPVPEPEPELESNSASSTVRKRPREKGVVLFKPTPESEANTPSGTPISIKKLRDNYTNEFAKISSDDIRFYIKRLLKKAQEIHAHEPELQAEEQKHQPNESPEVFDEHFYQWIEDAAKEDATKED